MRSISYTILGAFAVLLVLSLAPLAQAQLLPPVDVVPISASDVPETVHNYFSMQAWRPPMPFNWLADEPDIVLYFSPSRGTNAIWVDDTGINYAQRAAQAEVLRLAIRAANGGPPMPGEGGGGGGGGTNDGGGWSGPIYGTNDFYLEPLSVASNLFNVILHNTTNGSTYVITSVEALDPATNSVWLIEGSLQGGTNDATPFALGIALRTNNLFIRAQACDECATTTLPLAWQLAYFGVTGVDPNGDYDGDGVTNLVEFLNGTDPNKILFSLAVANQYVATTAVPVEVNIAGGVPSYIAVLVNDGNTTNASWQPFTSTSLSVPLPTNGTYVITVGLRGLPSNATQSWQTLTVFCDTTPLSLMLTNLPALSGSRPFIDPAGYASRALSTLTWTVVDASGDTNTGNGMVTAQGWSLSDRYHATNCWACLDLALALGTNWVSIQAVDWAGTVAVTNFTYLFDTNGDTTAPALSLVWPQDGTQVTGTNLTVQASVDDDTAAVALQYTDADAIVQTVSGRVERGGNVWFPSVPLLAGTNGFSMFATDAAGNVSTNNFSVVQTNVGLTVFALSQNQMQYAYATVNGSADDWDCTVTVNGVTATNLGFGSWVAYNVPLQPGGIVTLQATAQLTNGATAQVLLKQERDAIVFTQTYGYKLDYSFVPSTNTFEAHHFELQWSRGVGGTNTQVSRRVDPDGNVSSNIFIAVWPPDSGYLPSLDAQTWSGTYSNGVLINSLNWTAGPPAVEWVEDSASSGSWPDYYGVSWSESSSREVRLFTGGDASRQRQGLFGLSASLNRETELDQRVYDWDVLHWSQAFTPFLANASAPVAVPSEQITLAGLGCLGADSQLWTLEPDGCEPAITPKVLSALSAFSARAFLAFVPGCRAASVAGPNPSIYKSRLHVQANSNLLGARHIPPWANFCVGQKITFSPIFTPGLPVQPEVGPIKWTLTGNYVNDGTNVVRGGTFPTSSTNFFPNANLLTNQTTSAWWVSGASSPPKVESATLAEGLTFPNGKYLVVGARGKFTIYQPEIPSANVPPPTYSINTNGTDFLIYRMGEPIIWDLYVNANTNFRARLEYVQLINVTNSWDITNSSSGTVTTNNLNSAGQFWLDGSYPYTAQGTAGPYTNFTSPTNMGFDDFPWMVGARPQSFASASFRFYTYACFEPLSPGSIPIALGYYYWGWDGTLTYSGWTISLTTSNAITPTFTPQISTLPIWTNIWHRVGN
jgi:hypothetical protein